MKKRLASIVLCFVFIFTTVIISPTQVSATKKGQFNQFDKIKESFITLGIYKDFKKIGGKNGEKKSVTDTITVSEAIVMVVRAMGAEKIALAGDYLNTFTDVPKWAGAYVGYAKTVGIVTGNKLKGSTACTAEQFLTFLLRGALDYEKLGDVKLLAKKLNIISEQVNLKSFKLQDALLVTYNAMEAKINDHESGYTLSQRLINDFGCFTKKKYITQKLKIDKIIMENLKEVPQKEIKIVKSYEPYVVKGKKKEKVAYLTFDDGPNLVVTPMVLDILKHNKVKATFFLVGRYVDQYPKMVKRIYEEGHTIANHSYSHDYSKIYSNTDNFASDIKKAEKSINKALGFDYGNHIFRFPGGSREKDKKFKDKIYEMGYQYYEWNSHGADASFSGMLSVSEILRYTNQTIAGKDTLTMLYHDAATKRTTAGALPMIIKTLKDKGYTFKTLDDLE